MSRDKPAFVRALGLTDATMLVIGCIVGVGIFRTASSIAQHVTSPGLTLALWLTGGLLSLCGALCYAELAGMFPVTGGDYVYVTKIYGRSWGFLFGWTKLFIERTGTIAILGFVFAEYAQRLLGFGEPALRWVAVAAILLLTAVNVVGVRWGALVQNLFTALKMVALGCLVAAGARAFLTGQAPGMFLTSPASASSVHSLGVALVFVLWTYGGWTEAAYVAEEVREPERNVPRAIVGGLLLTTTLYLLVNASYLLFIPMHDLPSTPLVAAQVMERAAGPAGAVFISWMIACSAFGALNGYILTGGRILYAIGKDHPLFAALGRVDSATHTPALALWTASAVAAMLVFTKTFEQIMTYSTLAISIFFMLTVIGVIVLRRREPRRARPAKTFGYPWTPLAYCAVILAFMADVIVKRPGESAFGLLCVAAGVPLYLLSERLAK